MSHLAAIQQADAIFIFRDTLDQQGRVDAVVALNEWGIFSNRHLHSITGLHATFVGEITGKTDRSGGRLNPAALPLIARLITDDHLDSELVCLTLDAGVSATLLARFTGLAQSTLSRRARDWRAAQ